MYSFIEECDEVEEPHRERMQRSAPYQVSTQRQRTNALRHSRQKAPVGLNSAERRKPRTWN